MKTNIVLMGFISSGKSSVGKELGDRLGRPFIDIDKEIEKDAGKSPGDIVKEDGEIAFRELEIEQIKQASALDNVIISLGGGAIVNRINIDRLKLTGTVFYLYAPIEAIIERTLRQGSRPILDVDDREVSLRRLWDERAALWEPAADVVIDTTGKSVADIADMITAHLEKPE